MCKMNCIVCGDDIEIDLEEYCPECGLGPYCFECMNEHGCHEVDINEDFEDLL